MRPLGIATIQDLVVQTAAMLILEPIFEADLEPEQYAYRPDQSAHGAVNHVHRLLKSGHTEVIDADLSGYFDSIPHAELLRCVARGVVDGKMLHLIKMWLEVPEEESDGRGGRRRTTRARDSKRGIPQGSPISPLLSNLYMRRFILGWKRFGYAARFGARIVNYADDLVICCRHGAKEALEAMRHLMGRIKLSVNEEKTRLCRIPREHFDFLGYTFGRCYSMQGRVYVGTRPSKKSIRRIVAEISVETTRGKLGLSAEEMVGGLNRKLTGWANYFSLGSVSKAYRAIDAHTAHRLRQWLCRKRKAKGRRRSRYPASFLYDKLGLIHLPSLVRSLPWAKA